MRRLQKSQCGYDLYKCTGIASLPAPNPICCNSNATPVSRNNDNNFYNIPPRFLGIVQQTPYIDLSLLVLSNSICCDFRYDPFDSAGFRDLFDDIKNKLDNYAGSLTNYGCSNSSYNTSDAILKPGFLLPTPELNNFYPAVLQAVPTVALASPINSSSIKHGTPIESACTGFKITAQLVQDVLNISVSEGKALILGRPDGFITVPMDLPWTRSIAKQQTMNIEIYLIVHYDLYDRLWKGEFDYKQNGEFAFTPNAFAKQVQLGTIRVLGSTIQIVQQTCSPVDVRDWVSQVEIPQSLGLYLFSYLTGSTKMKWHVVKDC